MASKQNIGNAYISIHAEADKGFAKELGGIGEEGGSTAGDLFNNKFAQALTAIPAVLAGLGIGKMIGEFIGDSIDVGKTFDKSMSQVAATMGKTVDEIENLRDYAQLMGATTAFSASQAADALNYMALAGYKDTEAMEMLPNVLNLAASGNIELARASDMVTDAQSALGLEFAETTVLVDQMAKTASTTNTSVEQLGDAILTVGGTAKLMKGSTTELTQVLGLLADNGIKGAEGGTALRNIMLALTSPSAAAAETIEKLGLNVFDAEGNMRSMQDIILDLNAAMDGMTDKERTEAISSIFNARDLKSVNALLGTDAERWNEVADAISNAQGAAALMAETQLDNLAGDMTLLESATEGFQIKISDFLVPSLRSLAQFAGNALSGITGFFDAHKATFDALAKVLGGALKTALTVVAAAFDQVGGAISVVFSLLDPIFSVIESAFDKLVSAFQTTDEELQKNMSLWDLLGSVFGAVGEVIGMVLTPIIDGLIWVIQALAVPIQTIADKFQSLWNTVVEVWEGIKETIHNAIEKIKSFFDIKLEFPHIALPHFSVSGSFSADPPSVPAFEVTGYYAHGGIVDSPSLIMAGEAGREAIVPLTAPNISPFADAVAERLEGGGDTFIFNITADSATTLESLIDQARRARIAYGRA